MSLQSLKMLSNAIVFEKNIWLLTGLAGVHFSGHLLGPLKVLLSLMSPRSSWGCHQFHGIGRQQMLMLRLSSCVSTPRPSRTQRAIFYPHPFLALGCPGPDRRGCGTHPEAPGAHKGSLSSRSSLAGDRSGHLGHGHAVSREETGQHARATAVPPSLVRLGEC